MFKNVNYDRPNSVSASFKYFGAYKSFEQDLNVKIIYFEVAQGNH